MLARHAVLVCLSAVTLLVSCSSEPAKKATKEPAKPPEAVGAQYAFHQCYIMARTWAQDLEILRVVSIPVEGVKPEPGKSGAWEVVFVSATKARAKPFTYSVVEQGNMHKGVFSQPEENWAGRRGINSSFPTAAFKIDSTKAWTVAVEQSKEYMAKNPDMPISFLLEKTTRHPNSAWRVIWGTSPATSSYSILVDSTTGAFLEKLR